MFDAGGNTPDRDGNVTDDEGNVSDGEGMLFYREGSLSEGEGNVSDAGGNTTDHEGNTTQREGNAAQGACILRTQTMGMVMVGGEHRPCVKLLQSSKRDVRNERRGGRGRLTPQPVIAMTPLWVSEAISTYVDVLFRWIASVAEARRSR